MNIRVHWTTEIIFKFILKYHKNECNNLVCWRTIFTLCSTGRFFLNVCHKSENCYQFLTQIHRKKFQDAITLQLLLFYYWRSAIRPRLYQLPFWRAVCTFIKVLSQVLPPRDSSSFWSKFAVLYVLHLPSTFRSHITPVH